MNIDITLENAKEVQKDLHRILKAIDTHGNAVEKTMRDAVRLIQNDVVRFTPVDTGTLKASIWPQVISTNEEVQGIVGSQLKYAVFVETGTKPHVAPISALRGWAERHGIPVGAVWVSIMRFGTSVWAERKYGTKGYKMFEKAYKNNLHKVSILFERMIKDLTR